MKRVLLTLLIPCLMMIGHVYGQDEEVRALFGMKCGICHTIGMGKLIGPDLAYVQDRRSPEWLLTYIRSSQKMIQSGDPDAVAIYEEYNQMVMPDPMIPDTDIKAIITFISNHSADKIGPEFISVLNDVTPEDLDEGRLLYEGRMRFENGGPSCVSCHSTHSDIFKTESNLAKNVMKSFSALGEPGVKSILESPPFPVMAAAFEAHALEDDEIHDLLVYLRDGSEQPVDAEQSSLTANFLIYGALGGILLFILYSFVWFNRKANSVNYEIYERQLKSSN
ncbi:MAG: cytochrome c [Saprospiraceae bacterium]|nr:cytochrome c [Saprospiraceae bacterium]